MDVLVLGHHVLDRHAEDFPEQFHKRVDLKPGEVWKK
jgi:hypothetical protein